MGGEAEWIGNEKPKPVFTQEGALVLSLIVPMNLPTQLSPQPDMYFCQLQIHAFYLGGNRPGPKGRSQTGLREERVSKGLR